MTHQPSYTSLVAALRAEFTPDGIDGIAAALDSATTGRTAATAVLSRAARDAADPDFDPGENAHPALREWFTTGSGRADR